jgi:predicted aldo/keto reductase-like oxidoreductase
MGLGGEGLLRSHGRDKEAYALINKALDLGFNYFESARAYDGSEELFTAKALRDRRKDIFLAQQVTCEDKGRCPGNTCPRHCATSRRTTMDLWQIHDVRTIRTWRRYLPSVVPSMPFVEAKKGKGLDPVLSVFTGTSKPIGDQGMSQAFRFRYDACPRQSGRGIPEGFSRGDVADGQRT